MIRICFERLIEWDWPDAPARNPILHGDIPPRPEPLPKFLDDRDAPKLIAAARMLGNRLCTRPVELECRMESVCESCAYFATGPQFIPVLLRQRDHARDHDRPDRAALLTPSSNHRKHPLDIDHTDNASSEVHSADGMHGSWAATQRSWPTSSMSTEPGTGGT